MTTTTTKQTLKQLCENVRITNSYGARKAYDKQEDWQRKCTSWCCVLQYSNRQFTFDFWQGSAITKEPTAEGTLECLLSDRQEGEQTFEEFCSERGLDSDSRSAERTWEACRVVAKDVKRLLGSDYETFLYAERD